jgi:CheY-like chemotaxis protein/HPt (histidine-containing phosphotransfer) domain-containing protein
MGMEEASMTGNDAPSKRLFTGSSVLLVEDHPINQKVGKAMLEQLGCSVEVAGNGRLALEEHSRGAHDLILMDCQMPEMDGYEATRTIRKAENGAGKHIPIVALTAHALQGDREKSLEAGMDDHLSKPFTFNELSDALARYLPFQELGAVEANPPVSKNAEESPDRLPMESPDGEDSSAIDRIVLDRIRAIEAQGSTGLLKTIITYYVNESPSTFASLREALRANNPEAMRELAHSLKSASANVGAKTMADLCKEMELAGRTGTTRGGPELLARMEREFEIASKALTAEL